MTKLLPGTVDLWLVALDRPNLADDCRTLLSEDERTRAAQFQFEPPRRRFISGRGSLRQILGRYLDQPAESLSFIYGPQGKPELIGQIQFSLAHSGDQMLLAVAQAEPLGVDLEQIRPVPHLEAMATAYLSPKEVYDLRATPEPDRPQAFLRAWTQMEARAKLDGAGVSQFYAVPRQQPSAICPLVPQPGFVGALATKNPVQVIWRTL